VKIAVVVLCSASAKETLQLAVMDVLQDDESGFWEKA
jgi:hypothetical protein